MLNMKNEILFITKFFFFIKKKNTNLRLLHLRIENN